MEAQRKRRRQLMIHWMLYFLLLLCAAALQTMPGFLTIGSFKPYFILAVCLAVAFQEGEFYGALFGAVGGLLWDYTAGRTFGMLGIGILFLCFLVSVLVQLYLKPSSVNFFLLNLACGWLLLSTDFLFNDLMRGYANAARRYAVVILPEIVVSSLLAPLILLLVRRIAARLSPEE